MQTVQNVPAPLQLREIFHLEFLRRFGRKIEPGLYSLKGGVNLRLFFKSIRYSEDMDLDVTSASISRIQKAVLEILALRGFAETLKSFGIERVVAPDIAKAKQTETTQRFKIHLVTAGGEDLFTKIEFSRRGGGGPGKSLVQPVPAERLRAYKMGPLVVPHYDAAAAIAQKIHALAKRSIVQARDAFDLFVLIPQYEQDAGKSSVRIGGAIFKAAHERIFSIEFPQFRDTVLGYLDYDDQKVYSSPGVWDDIKLQTAHFLEELRHEDA